jgi:hypothetical protein
LMSGWIKAEVANEDVIATDVSRRGERITRIVKV